MGKSLGQLAPPEKTSQVGYGSYALAMDTLETAVTQGTPYLCGDQFTAADLYLTAALGWGMVTAASRNAPRLNATSSPSCSVKPMCAPVPSTTRCWPSIRCPRRRDGQGGPLPHTAAGTGTWGPLPSPGPVFGQRPLGTPLSFQSYRTDIKDLPNPMGLILQALNRFLQPSFVRKLFRRS